MRIFQLIKGTSIRLLILASVALSTLAQTNTLVAPAEAQNVVGDGFADPFFLTQGPVSQVYDASVFASLDSDIIRITAVAFRLDEAAGSMDVVIPKITLGFAVFQGPLSQADPFRTTDSAVVYQQNNVHLSASSPAGSVPDFEISFKLSQPFDYNRQSGLLVLNIDSHQTGGKGQSMDAQFSTHGLLFTYEGGPINPMRVIRSEMIVTDFTYEAVPEPGTLRLIALSILISVIPHFSYNRKRRDP